MRNAHTYGILVLTMDQSFTCDRYVHSEVE